MSVIECHFGEVRQAAKQLDTLARQAKADLDAGKTELTADTSDWNGIAKEAFSNSYTEKDAQLKDKILKIEAMSIYLNKLADKIEEADKALAAKRI